jgi:hypothetical protein
VVDRRQATGELLALAEVLGAQLSAGAVALYVGAVEDLTLEELKRGCAAAARSTTFHAMPTPAELRLHAGKRPPPTVEQVAGEAWDQVLACLSRGSGWAELPRPTRQALKAIGGSSRVTTADDQRGLGAVRARFVEAFARLSSEAQARVRLPDGMRLVGGGS